jgi:hypothetical protein
MRISGFGFISFQRSPSFESFRPSLFVVTFLFCLFNLGLFANCKSFQGGICKKEEEFSSIYSASTQLKKEQGLFSLCHGGRGPPPPPLQAKETIAPSHSVQAN